MAGTLEAVRLLKQAGARDVWIDGSFVTSKWTPNDWDGCYGSIGLDLDALDPLFRDLANLTAGRPRQHQRFGGEFIPAFIGGGAGRTMLDFFQTDREGRAKGIVRIDMESVR